MNPAQKQLVRCCREQWMAGHLENIELWEDGLRLDHSRYTSGRYTMSSVDSGENGFEWGRVVVEADLPIDTALRVYAHVSDHRSWGDWPDIDSVLRKPSDEKISAALKTLFGPPAAKSGDFYIKSKGRYLWLMLELAATGKAYPIVHKVRIRMGGDHMADYLPAIYREDDFTFRFMSIFDSVLLDMEKEIAALPERLDYESANDDMLTHLASWICLHDSPDNLRLRIPGALSEYESQYTALGIRRSIRRLTGREPYLIEHFNVSPNRQDCRNPELYRRLYGGVPHRFFVLLEEGSFAGRQALESFCSQMEKLVPAGTSMELVLLKQCIQLDWHTYLGINSRLGGYVAAAIDENMTIHYDTTIGGVNHEV